MGGFQSMEKSQAEEAAWPEVGIRVSEWAKMKVASKFRQGHYGNFSVSFSEIRN